MIFGLFSIQLYKKLHFFDRCLFPKNWIKIKNLETYDSKPFRRSMTACLLTKVNSSIDNCGGYCTELIFVAEGTRNEKIFISITVVRNNLYLFLQ
jgi:hypothetical protein